MSAVRATDLIENIDLTQIEDTSTDSPHSWRRFSPRRDALGMHFQTYDTATLRFVRSDNQNVSVWMQTDLCIGCKLLLVAELFVDGKEDVLPIDTTWAIRIAVTEVDAPYPGNNNTFCQLYNHFGQFGVYNLTLPSNIPPNGSNVTQCPVTTVKKPVYSYTVAFVSYSIPLAVAICAALWYYCIKKRFRSSLNVNTIPPTTETPEEDRVPLTTKTQTNKPGNSSLRLRSVDTFRGFVITHLVCGTSGDGHFFFLSHAVWYGITVADFMFPWFVFIMGTSIHLAFNILLSKGCSFFEIFKKIVKRSLILFILGVCIQPQNDLLTLRIPGVLQRFGITYFIVASCYLFSRWLQARRKTERTNSCFLMFRDILQYIELPVAALCILVHVMVTFYLPVPGCPRGYQGPGGPLVGVNGELTNCTGGAAGYIDRAFFTPAHLIKTGKIIRVYHNTVPHDPEGILGTLNCIALCIFGLQAGKILHHFQSVRGRLVRLLMWGLLLITCSAVLSKCTMADGWIPLNKNLWSFSFICLTGGVGFLATALFHVLIDVTHFWNGSPLFYPGMNTMLLYIGAEIMTSYLPFSWTLIVGNHAEYIFMGYWSMTLWVCIAYIAYRKKFFVKI
ncbi:heparan-alpha-glucosaminide N-acetyltransferase-like [Diadema antillarum]|uniref:heparan-alpha-glucosaminide N-acetyltransferase-like n=1 Tax=Diadema antillarum TaxID=105358 RepID=UPI003A835292